MSGAPEKQEGTKHLMQEFVEEKQDNPKQEVSVQNPNRGRKKKCIILVVVVVIICLVAAVTIALVLLLKDDKSATPGMKTASLSSNATENWSNWTLCSVTCGNGTKQRSRGCQINSNCHSSVETIPCVMLPCTEPARWGHWSQWSQCSVTCANGIQARNRTCIGSDVSSCQGSQVETRGCTLAACPRKDCLDLFSSGKTSNGIYTIDPDNQGFFQVYCDMTTDGGGWTVFQRRQNGSEEDFFRNWTEYKTGFGNLLSAFWLGNDKIHRLTANHVTRLGVDLQAWSEGLKNATYETFRVENETLDYTLTVQTYSGNAGDSFTQHNGMKFTTKDRDNDKEPSSNCAVGYHGGWWFNACLPVNLNGKYVGNASDRKGIIWLLLSTNAFDSLKYTQMRIRRR